MEDLVATDEHRSGRKFSRADSWRAFSSWIRRIFRNGRPQLASYCFIENQRTVGIPSEFGSTKLFIKNQAANSRL